MARKNVKVDIHVNKIEALMTLLSNVNKKHIALGTDSPIQHIDMAYFDSKLEDYKSVVNITKSEETVNLGGENKEVKTNQSNVETALEDLEE